MTKQGTYFDPNKKNKPPTRAAQQEVFMNFSSLYWDDLPTHLSGIMV